MPFTRYLYFCFVGSLIVSFAMDETESKGADVAVNFFRLSLLKMLTIFWRCITAKKGF